MKSPRRRLIDAARLEIFERAPALAIAEQNLMKIGRGPLVQPVKRLSLLRVSSRCRILKPLDHDPVTFADALHRLGEAQLVVLHQKMENAASRAAAEAMKNSFFFVDGERGSLFGVKRAEAEMVTAGFFKRQIIRDHFHDGSAIADLEDLFFGNHGAR